VDATVLITGGSSGLGEAVAAAVLRDGGRPVVLDRREPAIDVEFELVDLADTRAAEAATRKAASGAGGVDAVVCAAGMDACGPLADVPGDDWDRVVRVNLLGTAAVIRAAMPWLLERHGRVVTVASTLGWRALPEASAYCASKFGVVGFTRALAAELGGRVGVTLLLPGGMQTRFFDDRPEQYRPGPDVKLARPEDVAQAVLFALNRPQACEVRELMVTSPTEASWP
jgi:NAD(P)-dependent dehydrogenase (short-subunit alcohol dehydrogenase family)